jgi:phosphatidylglycerol:prolipoprotein diacylglycerol transferase
MLAIAFTVGISLACSQARGQGLDADAIFNLGFAAIISGIIGARLLYVLLNLGTYLENPLEIIMLQHGGLAWFGGLLLGSAGGWFYIKRKKLPLYSTLDLLAPFVALSQAIGRIGCLLNGCCYGKESPFGLYFPVMDKVLIPTQLISSVSMVVIYIVLRLLQENPHRRGQVFFLYLALYGAKRFLVEFLRGDTPAILFGLTIFQYFSIALFCFACWRLTRMRLGR